MWYLGVCTVALFLLFATPGWVMLRDALNAIEGRLIHGAGRSRTDRRRHPRPHAAGDHGLSGRFADVADFTELKTVLDATQGNLSVHHQDAGGGRLRRRRQELRGQQAADPGLDHRSDGRQGVFGLSRLKPIVVDRDTQAFSRPGWRRTTRQTEDPDLQGEIGPPVDRPSTFVRAGSTRWNDEVSFLQRYTPRGKKSVWSQVKPRAKTHRGGERGRALGRRLAPTPTAQNRRVMGIVNVTPDSFSDGGRLATDDVEAAVAHALRLVEQGADIVLDIGGESTRPGAEPVNAAEEIARDPAGDRGRPRALGRADQHRHPEARGGARRRRGRGDDVERRLGPGYAPDSLATAARLGCDVVLMHMKGEPRTMQARPPMTMWSARWSTIWLEPRRRRRSWAGVARERIWLDPGIGFGKTAAHNLALTARLEGWSRWASRSSMRPAASGRSRRRPDRVDPADRLGGSLALALEGARRGAHGWSASTMCARPFRLKLQTAVLAAVSSAG
jgi:dihydropteroate synthase